MATLTASAKLDKAVADFKSTFAANPALVTNGQFQLVDANLGQIFTAVEREFAAVVVVPPDLRDAFDRFKANFQAAEPSATIAKIIKERKLEATFPETTRIFGPDGAAAERVRTGFSALWTSSGVPAAPFVADATQRKVMAAWEREKGACHDTTVSMGRKLLHTTGRTVSHNKSLYSAGQIAQARLASAGGNRQKIVYDAKQLTAALGQIRTALSKGYVYLGGAMSGQNHTNVGQKFPNPEHWLLIFDFDGDAFVFWDSDSITSNIGSFPSWGAGFGVLFDRDNRFSTAMDQTDFDNLDSDGIHLAETKRHCYQVYLASPLP